MLGMMQRESTHVMLMKLVCSQYDSLQRNSIIQNYAEIFGKIIFGAEVLRQDKLPVGDFHFFYPVKRVKA